MALHHRCFVTELAKQTHMLTFFAGQRLTPGNMVLFLEYLPQEPSDPVYSKLFTGSASYEWESASLFRVCALPYKCLGNIRSLSGSVLVMLSEVHARWAE